MMTGEKDKIVKVKVEIKGADYTFQAKGKQSNVVDLAIKSLKDYKDKLGVI